MSAASPPRGGLVVVASAALLVLAGLGAVAVGSVTVPLGEILGVLAGGEASDPSHTFIIGHLRLPRVALAALVGGALGLAGATLQTLLRNPLADPYVLGVSSGAALGAAIALVSGVEMAALGLGARPLAAFVGAAAAGALVFLVARRGGALPLTGVLLAGVAVGLTCSAGMSLVLLRAEARAADLVLWLMGHLGGHGWGAVGWVAVWCAVGATLVAWSTRELDVLAQGAEVAEGLGVPVQAARLRLLVAVSLLVGAAVAFCGLIGFVGLIVPHVVRFFTGPRHRWLLPASTLGGAACLVGADLGARALVSSAEIPVGVVTGLLGGPFFLVILRRRLAHVGA